MGWIIISQLEDVQLWNLTLHVYFLGLPPASTVLGWVLWKQNLSWGFSPCNLLGECSSQENETGREGGIRKDGVSGEMQL